MHNLKIIGGGCQWCQIFWCEDKECYWSIDLCEISFWNLSWKLNYFSDTLQNTLSSLNYCRKDPMWKNIKYAKILRKAWFPIMSFATKKWLRSHAKRDLKKTRPRQNEETITAQKSLFLFASQPMSVTVKEGEAN